MGDNMRNVLRLVATVTFTVLATITLYAQPEFPLGVYLFDLTNVDYQQIRIDLGATWVQGWGGWQGNPQGVETNTVGLKALPHQEQHLYVFQVAEDEI